MTPKSPLLQAKHSPCYNSSEMMVSRIFTSLFLLCSNNHCPFYSQYVWLSLDTDHPCSEHGTSRNGLHNSWQSHYSSNSLSAHLIKIPNLYFFKHSPFCLWYCFANQEEVSSLDGHSLYSYSQPDTGVQGTACSIDLAICSPLLCFCC